MKICNRCASQNDDSARFCVSCGSPDLRQSEAAPAENAFTPADAQEQASAPLAPDFQQNVAATAPQPDLGNGNIVAGVVGAFLFALIGGLLYFVVYQIGIIAGICGLVTMVLANFGYHLFAKGNKNTTVGLIVSIVITLVMIFIAEYFCISYEIYKAFSDQGYGMSIFDAVKLVPQFLAESAVKEGFIKDLAFAYLFTIIASISNIISNAKAAKKAAK